MSADFLSREDRLIRARRSRDEALRLVSSNASQEYKDVALRAVRYIAQQQPAFITDHIHDAMARSYPELGVHEMRVWGAVMRRAVAEGYCLLQSCEHCHTTKVMRPGRRAHGNATDMPEYRSLLWSPP